NVLKAQKALRDEYESFREIGENTIRRMLPDEGFAEMVAAEGKLLAEAAAAGAAQAERERARREAEGTMMARLGRDDAILDEARTRIEEVLKDKEQVDPALAVKAFGMLAKIIDARRNAYIPAIAETREATVLIETLLECCIAEFGEAR